MAKLLLVLAPAILATPLFASIEKVWVQIEEPHDQALIRDPYPLVEIRGWAGTGIRGDHDVVLVLNRSGSTFEASGSPRHGHGDGSHGQGGRGRPREIRRYDR